VGADSAGRSISYVPRASGSKEDKKVAASREARKRRLRLPGSGDKDVSTTILRTIAFRPSKLAAAERQSAPWAVCIARLAPRE
jgi:hypothetical protein